MRGLVLLGGMALPLLVACGGEPAAPLDAPQADAAIDGAPPQVAAPDPRFKGVGAYAAYSSHGYEISSYGIGFTLSHSLFTPTATNPTDPRDLTWAYEFSATDKTFAPVESHYDLIGTSQIALLGEFERSRILTSLDFTTDAFAMTSTATDASPSITTHVGSTADLAALTAWVTGAAAQGQVTTAVAYDGTAIEVVAYASDATPYDVSVVSADATTVQAQAQALASAGYIIAAFGRLDASHYALVGTRTSSAAPARSIMIAGYIDSSMPAMDLLAQGYAIVGGYVDASAAPRFILEK